MKLENLFSFRAALIFLAALLLCPPARAAPPDAVPALPDFSVAGIDDPAMAASFLATLQDVVARNDRPALAALVSYPFSLYDSGTATKTYADEAALLADFDAVFTPAVKQAIRGARADDLFVNYQGVMIGGGEAWFGPGAGGALRIVAVNPR